MMEVTLDAQPGGTRMTLTSTFASAEQLDEMVKMGMEEVSRERSSRSTGFLPKLHRKFSGASTCVSPKGDYTPGRCFANGKSFRDRGLRPASSQEAGQSLFWARSGPAVTSAGDVKLHRHREVPRPQLVLCRDVGPAGTGAKAVLEASRYRWVAPGTGSSWGWQAAASSSAL